MASSGAGPEGGGQERLKVGEKVVLADDYASHGDASGGPLKPGDVGTLKQDDHDSKPFKVNFNGRDYWYKEAALKRAPAGGSRLAARMGAGEEKSSSGESRLRPGARVVLICDDAEADWSGFARGASNRLSFSEGSEHTVAEVDGAFFTTTNYGTLWAPVSAARLLSDDDGSVTMGGAPAGTVDDGDADYAPVHPPTTASILFGSKPPANRRRSVSSAAAGPEELDKSLPKGLKVQDVKIYLGTTGAAALCFFFQKTNAYVHARLCCRCCRCCLPFHASYHEHPRA